MTASVRRRRYERRPNRVNDCLAEMGVTQVEVAEDLGTYASAISTLANGRRVLRTDGVTFSGPARRLAAYLGRPPEWLWPDIQEGFERHPNVVHCATLPEVADATPEPADVISVQEDLRLLRAAVNDCLTAREWLVIQWRFGFKGTRWTRSQVGDVLNLSGRRIGQIESQALRKLHAYMEEKTDGAPNA